MAAPYKHFLGRGLACGLRANSFDFPSGKWPPPTPARHYIEEFLDHYLPDVQGRCVEFAPAYYRKRFAGRTGSRITTYSVWDVAPGEGVTVVGDLQRAPQVPDGSFDTIICTHVLCSIPRPWLAVEEMRRILAPGGVVLCTNPVILQNYSPHPKDCWRFTKDSMETLFSNFSRVNIHSYGNAATVAGSPFFLMSYHFPKWLLSRHDPECPSVIAAAAWK